MGDSVVYAIKIGLAVACTMAFVVAVITLVGLLTSFVSSSIIGEIIGLMSIYLPFDPVPVFTSLTATITAILAFLIAHKIWDLTGQTYKMS